MIDSGEFEVPSEPEEAEAHLEDSEARLPSAIWAGLAELGPEWLDRVIVSGTVPGLAAGSFNLIPGGRPGACRTRLVVAVDSSRWSLHDALAATRLHLIRCQGTREVVVVSDSWSREAVAVSSADLLEWGVTARVSFSFFLIGLSGEPVPVVFPEVV